MAGEAVDLGTFTGYKLTNRAITMKIGNTNRFGPNGLLYHFARRSSQYEQVPVPNSQGNTCEYFKNGDPNNKYTAPCKRKGPELDQIRNWAFALQDPSQPRVNCPSMRRANLFRQRRWSRSASTCTPSATRTLTKNA